MAVYTGIKLFIEPTIVILFSKLRQNQKVSKLNSNVER